MSPAPVWALTVQREVLLTQFTFKYNFIESAIFIYIYMYFFFPWDKERPRDKTGRIPGAVSSPSQPVLCCHKSCFPGLWGSPASHCSHAVRGKCLHPSRWEAPFPKKSFHSFPWSWSQGTLRARNWTTAVPETSGQQELGCVCPKAVELESSICLSREVMRGNLCYRREKAKIKGKKTHQKTKMHHSRCGAVGLSADSRDWLFLTNGASPLDYLFCSITEFSLNSQIHWFFSRLLFILRPPLLWQ